MHSSISSCVPGLRVVVVVVVLHHSQGGIVVVVVVVYAVSRFEANQ